MKLSILLPSKKEPNAHKTLRECQRLFPAAQVIISPDEAGRGKGWAVRKAMHSCTGDVIVMLDADFDIEPRMISRLLPFLEDFDIVVGAKDYTGMKFGRKVLMLLSRIYIRIMFNLNFTTQTGIKALHRSVMPYWENNNFMFDLEFLAKAYKKGFSVIEVPVKATIVRKKSPKVIFQALTDSLKIWWKLHKK